MSLDIDLTADDDPVYVSLVDSAGVVRLRVAEAGGHPKAMSAPVPRAALVQLKQFLDVHLDDEAPSVAVHARPECTFCYCPNPEACAPAGRCVHPAGPPAAEDDDRPLCEWTGLHRDSCPCQDCYSEPIPDAR